MTIAEFLAEVQEVYENADVDIRSLQNAGVQVEALTRVRDQLDAALTAIEHERWANK